MKPGSNSAGRIAELRKEMHRQRGLAKRTGATARELWAKAWSADKEAARPAREIETMGGKVKR